MHIKLRCRSCGSPHVVAMATAEHEPVCGCCTWRFRDLFLPKGADLIDKLRLLLPCVTADPGVMP